MPDRFTTFAGKILAAAVVAVVFLPAIALAAADGILANPGHLDPQVLFYASGPRVDVFFTADGVVFDVKDLEPFAQARAAGREPGDASILGPRRGQALYLTFPGANPDVRPEAGGITGARYSFFMGDDPSRWTSGRDGYRTVTYRNLWDGVDVEFTLDGGNLTYRVIGAADRAQFAWLGADGVTPAGRGQRLETAYGALLDDGRTLAPAFDGPTAASADKGAAALLWSTLLGGSDSDEGTSLAIAANGDIFVTCETASPDFPGTPGAYEENHFNYLDIAVSRFADQGATLVWSSFVGTSSLEYVNALALDAAGNPIFGGRSTSTAFPTTVGAYDRTNAGNGDATLSKLSADGSTLLMSTFIGGNQVDSIFDLAVDADGNIVCAGYTASADYPTTPGCFQDYFAGPPYDFTVSTLSADGSTLLASTYIGGTDRDACRGVAIDANGDLFLAGFSFSTDFPVTPGVFQEVKSTIDDAALVKMSPDLTTILWSTYMGGDNSERALAVDLDADGDPVIAGFTYSTDFPTSPGAFQTAHAASMDAFAAKFSNLDGSRQWATYLGGVGTDEATSVMLDAGDNPVLTGWTGSANFPVNAYGFDDTHNGGEDVFVSRLAADGGSLLWGTFLGGTGTDHGLEVIIDGADNPVVTGSTSSTNFPVSVWAWDQTPAGGTDAFLARFDTGDANLAIGLDAGTIGCGTTATATFTYTPDLPHTPGLRGYSVRIVAPAGLTFGESDVTVLSPLPGVNDTFQVVENGPGDCTIDFSFLDLGAALETAGDLFTIAFTGTAEGASTIGVASGVFRDAENHPFDVDIIDTAIVTVDCTPPSAPVLDAEPPFTGGNANTVSWTDTSGGDAVAFNVQASLAADFAAIEAESGYIGALSHEFTGLTGGVLYHFRVFARDGNLQVSAASDPDSSRQDDTAPVSSVDALPAAVGMTFPIAVTAGDDLSGVASLELFYNLDGGAFASAGSFPSSPITFVAPDGDGVYGFYTLATDSVGNVETKTPAVEAATSVDTTAPDAPTLDAEPAFTAGTANTVACSDESASGAVAYRFELSATSDFAAILATSGPDTLRSAVFGSLTDGQTYHFRAFAVDELGNVSEASASQSSTQDASAPVSAVAAPGPQSSTSFDLAYTAVDSGSGVASVELFASFEGGPLASAGVFTSSPAAFVAAQGEGVYGFASAAVDSVGNAEAVPVAPAVTCVVDLTAPVSQLAALPPFQTAAVFDLVASGSDNLAGLAGYTFFYSLDAGPWTSAGAGPDSVFTFTAPADGQFAFYCVAVDSAGNTEDAPVDPDAVTVVDTNGPTGAFAINGGAAATNDTTVTLDVAVGGAIEMRFSNDGATFPEGWVALAASHPWTIGPETGEHVVHGEFRDEAGNLLALADTILVDIVAPGTVSFVNADPAHEAVLLTWHDPDDADLDHVEIWRGLLHDGSNGTVYPDYVGGVVPTAPADRAAALASIEWELAGTAAAGAEAFADTVLARGVYHYEFFAVDGAGNIGAPLGNLPAATDYILGDIFEPFDGLVRVADLTTLGASYGLADGEPGFNKDADVGPTSDLSGTGLPQPDDMVDFEDLMVTALNYGATAAAQRTAPAAAKNAAVVMSWARTSDRTYVLGIVDGAAALKGVRLQAQLPDGVTAAVAAGDLVAAQDQPVFVQNIASRGLDAGCAVMGTGVTFTGTGTLLTVTFDQAVPVEALPAEALDLTLRGAANEVLAVSFAAASAVPTPTAFALGANFPNPFNPSTTIGFALPQSERVRLDVYGIDGRRVAVLVDESLAAGQHEITWTGRDDGGRQVASGVYFYRLRAGSFEEVRKMTLVK